MESPINIPKKSITDPVHQHPIHNNAIPIITFLAQCELLVKIPTNPTKVRSPPIVKENVPIPFIMTENTPPIWYLQFNPKIGKNTKTNNKIQKNIAIILRDGSYFGFTIYLVSNSCFFEIHITLPFTIYIN